METAFDLLEENGRSNFLRLLMESFQCSYVCFWSHVPSPTNCLRFQDGKYREDFHSQLPSSSSGSLAQRLFYEYRQSTFSTINAENEHVPGFAFRNSIPYLEFEESQLQRLASNETQRQFYQEARIKTAVFMGCKVGEIELGLTNVPTINTKIEMQSVFRTEDLQTGSQLNPIQTEHRNPHYSSSSSSLRSLSNIDSPEYSSLLFNIPAISTSPCSQALARLRNPKFPSPETEEEAMTKAILAVLTSSLPPAYDHPLINTKSSAFGNYNPASSSTSAVDRYLGRKESMFKRSIRFFRSLNLVRNNRQTLQIPRPSSTQLHHMMSERKRREKLNENFHALRSLLPPGTKKDKASLLNTTKQYLTSLKAEIEELSRRNKQLEAQIFPSIFEADHGGEEEPVTEPSSSGDRRSVEVQVIHVSESGTEDRRRAEIVDLRVVLARSAIPVNDLVIRILEFLKRVESVSLVSLEASANHDLTESRTPINRVILRLRVEGNEWDKSAFQEAVRRVVGDLAQ